MQHLCPSLCSLCLVPRSFSDSSGCRRFYGTPVQRASVCRTLLHTDSNAQQFVTCPRDSPVSGLRLLRPILCWGTRSGEGRAALWFSRVQYSTNDIRIPPAAASCTITSCHQIHMKKPAALMTVERALLPPPSQITVSFAVADRHHLTIRGCSSIQGALWPLGADILGLSGAVYHLRCLCLMEYTYSGLSATIINGIRSPCVQWQRICCCFLPAGLHPTHIFCRETSSGSSSGNFWWA